MITPQQKPTLSFWEIWNMSFGFLGIQFGFALQNGNVSRIFETLGADIDAIPILWIAAPLTGLIVQPLIGYFSDRTWNRLGRRRPYFLIGAILASAALFFMPNSPALWVAAGMLWIMDAAINVSMEPFRAFVGDNLPEKQRTTGFAMQSFFIGIGAVIASCLPYILTNWFGVSNTAPDGIIPDSVKWSFYLGGLIFLLAVLYTVIFSKEYSPEQMAAFEASEGEKATYNEKMTKDEFYANGGIQQKIGWITMIPGIVLAVIVMYSELAKELYVLAGLIFSMGSLMVVSGSMQRSGKEGSILVTMMNDFQHMPKAMKELAWVQFFSWFALFAMWIYTTNGVTSSQYDMTFSQETIGVLAQKAEKISVDDPEKLEKAKDVSEMLAAHRIAGGDRVVELKLAKYFSDKTFQEELALPASVVAEVSKVQKEYNEGADWVGICFGVYNGFAAFFAFLLIYLAKVTSRKMTHLIALVVGGIGLISIYFVSDPMMLLLSFVAVGMAWASILSMPYAILTGSLPAEKMGYYMGVFNFFIVVPQLVAATILGFLVSYFFGGESIYALIIGGISMIVAGILTLRVSDES